MTAKAAPLERTGENPAALTVLFAGGGTGGHLFPGIAVAEELRRRRPASAILFAGSERPIDRRILERSGFETVPLPAESLTTLRRAPWRFVRGTWNSFRAARRLLAERRPTVVVGLGGFASAAVVASAARRRIPVVLLEQNVIPGRATRWLSRWCDALCVSFPETLEHLPAKWRRRCVVTGNPVREEIVKLHHRKRECEADRSERTLLVLGGSLGSQSVNELTLAFAERSAAELRGWRIAHQAGEQAAAVASQYTALGVSADVASFFENMPDQYARADLVVSRAGATTLAEVACAGIPAVLIPYPLAADDHQRVNADVFAGAGAAISVSERPSLGAATVELCRVLKPLLVDADERSARGQAMRSRAMPDAAARVAETIEKVCIETPTVRR